MAASSTYVRLDLDDSQNAALCGLRMSIYDLCQDEMLCFCEGFASHAGLEEIKSI